MRPLLSLWPTGMLSLGLAMLVSHASADQCTRLSLSDAQLALALVTIQRAPAVLGFCEPCGEQMPKSLSIAEAAKGLQDTSEDAAYLYVQTSGDTFTNLASIVACPTDAVSTHINRWGQPR